MIRVHDLRHSHASMLVEQGVDPLLIANRLGHEQVTTTLGIYSHLYPDKGQSLAATLDELKEHSDHERAAAAAAPPPDPEPDF